MSFQELLETLLFVASLSQAQAVTAIEERLADGFSFGFAGQGRQFSGESLDFQILKSQRHYCILAKFSNGGAGRHGGVDPSDLQCLRLLRHYRLPMVRVDELWFVILRFE